MLLEIINSERFADMAPASIFATLLDEGRYHGGNRTMYRLLAVQQQSGERRRQRAHPVYARPELLAVRANEVWSWDITKLKGPQKWTCFHLYVLLDIFSRYVVGWMVALHESAELAEHLIADTTAKQQIAPGTLTLHADRGTSMRSKPVAALLIDLEIAKSHSRPHVCDDNPYSEAQFKILKYRPDFPERFGCIEDARVHCQQFFPWYNTAHRHSGIGLMTPESVHYGRAAGLTAVVLALTPQLRLFNVLDDFNREGLAIEVDLSLPSARVIRTLQQVIDWRGRPRVIHCDNGPEYISGTLLQWAAERQIRIEYIQPGKPQQNAYVERYNRTVRYDWLAQHIFASIDEVQEAATRWLWTYNNEAPQHGTGWVALRAGRVPGSNCDCLV